MLDKALTAVSELESAYHTWKVLPLVRKKEVVVRIQGKAPHSYRTVCQRHYHRYE